MDLLTTIIYSITQGFTNFLPISNNAHYTLLSKYLQFQNPRLYFESMMFLGITSALTLYYWKKIFSISKIGLQIFPIFHKDQSQTLSNTHLFRNIFSSTFFTIIFTLVIKQVFFNQQINTKIISLNLFFFGILLYLGDLWAKKKEQSNIHNKNISFNEGFKFKESVLIALAQSLAVLPGICRCGFIFTTSRFLNLSKKESLEYCYLLYIPVTALATISKFSESLTIFMIEPAIEISLNEFTILMFVTFFITLITSIFTIHYSLKLIEKINFLYIAIYRSFIAIIIFFQ